METGPTEVEAAVAAPGVGADEPLGEGLGRIAASRFDRIVEMLEFEPDRDVAVHEARKAVKRLRALLRLLRGPLSPALRGVEDAALRDLGRRLAPARDARVVIDALDSIAAGDHLWIRDCLLRDHRAVISALGPGSPLVAALLASARDSRRWWVGTMPALVPDAVDSVSIGMRRTRALARRRAARALEQGGDEAFHAWRKQVKHLRHQLETVRPIDPSGFGGIIADLDTLGEVLGADHDLTVLLRQVGPLGADPGEAARLERTVAARKQELRAVARHLADRALGATAGSPVRRLQARWERTRTGGRQLYDGAG
jgi:CHAD domain-containing protein